MAQSSFTGNSPLIADMLYYFSYYYGNGDYYTGRGVADVGTYYIGQVIYSPQNETGGYGYYQINDATYPGYDSDIDGSVRIQSYYDFATDLDGNGLGGYGKAHEATGTGYSGLGSEVGAAYNSSYSNPDSYISNYYSADLNQAGDQLFSFTYYYGNGDSYSGYGFASAGTHYSGKWLYGTYNETYNYGYYYISYVSDLGYDSQWDGNVAVNSYFDAATDYDGAGSGGYGTAYYTSGSGNSGLGSESGYAYNSSSSYSDIYFSSYFSADLVPPSDQLFLFTYYYGNGDSYSGYGFASAGTHYGGKWLYGTYNETYSYGYYYISHVSDLGYDSQWDGFVAVNSYYDAATDYDGAGSGGYGNAYYTSGSGYSGLGSESGGAYNSGFSNFDNYFTSFYSADLV
jgi:hypothetical protein